MEVEELSSLCPPSPHLAGESYRERSSNLWADPKMRELKHYERSHNHEERLREAARLDERGHAARGAESRRMSIAGDAAVSRKNSLRTEGCDAINQQLERLSGSKAVLPHICSTAELPESFRADAGRAESEVSLDTRQAQQRRMSRFQTRLQWRDQMDLNLRRLMQDVELARDDRLKEYMHKCRCEHLDKIYTWYLTHGKKEARKERPAPPYVRFSPSGPVWPGSLRVAAKAEESVNSTPTMLFSKSSSREAAHGMGHSHSLPTLSAVASPMGNSAVASPKAEPQAAGGIHGPFGLRS